MNTETNLDEKVSIKLADATAPQLRRFAKFHLGLPISPNPAVSPAKIRSVITAARPDLDTEDAVFELSQREIADIEAASVPKPPKPQKQAAATAPATVRSGPRPLTDEEKVYWVYIDREKGDQGNQRVEVSCNGRAVLIPRGQAAPISYGTFNALSDAIEEIYESLKDGGIEAEPRKVPRYPWRMASEIEIEKFKRANATHPYVVNNRVAV